MRKLHIFLADTLFVLHCLLGIFILVGWLYPEIKAIYLIVLVLWLSSWIFLGYCPPTKWEFSLRKKYNKDIDSDAEIIQYYLYKFFKIKIHPKLVFNGGLILFIVLVTLTLIVY